MEHIVLKRKKECMYLFPTLWSTKFQKRKISLPVPDDMEYKVQKRKKVLSVPVPDHIEHKVPKEKSTDHMEHKVPKEKSNKFTCSRTYGAKAIHLHPSMKCPFIYEMVISSHHS
jgi:hypothetical protein